jgi:NTP pyrophosphatase (non-canonical NTP hydrolase)
VKGFFVKRYCPTCGRKYAVNERGLIGHHYEAVDVGTSWSRERLRHPCSGWRQKGLKRHPAQPGGPSDPEKGNTNPAHAGVPPPPTPALTFAQFSEINRQRCESPDGFKHKLGSWSTSDWFLAALGELGEAANIAKKLNRYRDGIPGNKESEAALRDKLRKELGDVFVYLDLLAQSLGFDIGSAAVEVFNAKSEEIGCSIRALASPPRPEPPVK